MKMPDGQNELTLLKSPVPTKYAGMSLMEYLQKRYPYRNPQAWQGALDDRKLLLNNKPATGKEKLIKGDLVSYWVALREPPVDKNIQVLFEDDHLLVANKPATLPSHSDGNFIKHTFIFLLTEMLKQRGYQGKLWLCHRLDRETSGLMVVAKTREALADLLRQFESGAVSKEYRCIVAGVMEKDSYRVDQPVARDEQSEISIRWAVVPEGSPGAKESVTEFKVLERLDGYTLVAAFPKTGRTNQIRVHLAYLGHPVVGDKLYGRTDTEFLDYIHHVKAGGDQAFGGRYGADRQLLHAYGLSLTHPVNCQPITFTAPLPEDLIKFLHDKKGEK